MSTASDALAILGISPLWGPLVKVAQDPTIDLQSALSEARAAEALVKAPTPSSIPGVRRKLKSLDKNEITAEERKNIRKSLQLLRPRSKTEKEVQELAGRGLTPGQVARYMGVGGVVVGGLGAARRGITQAGKHGVKSLVAKEGVKQVLHPSSIGADALYGTALGALPVLRRKLDIEAARRGQF